MKKKKLAKRLRARALELQKVPDSRSDFLAAVLVELADQLAPLSKKKRKKFAKLAVKKATLKVMTRDPDDIVKVGRGG